MSHSQTTSPAVLASAEGDPVESTTLRAAISVVLRADQESRACRAVSACAMIQSPGPGSSDRSSPTCGPGAYGAVPGTTPDRAVPVQGSSPAGRSPGAGGNSP